MRFTTSKKAFEKALKTAAKWADSKNRAVPVLGGVLFSVGNHVKITTTNLQATYQDTIDATPESPGEIAVNCKELLKILKNTNGNLVFQSTEDCLEITETDGTTYTLEGMAGNDSPSVKDSMRASGQVNQVNSENLKGCLERVLPAASVEQTRINLETVLFQQNRDNIRMVATDGRRLHISSTEYQGEVEDILIPRQYLHILCKTLPKKPVDVTFIVHDQNILFEIGTKRISIRLAEGDFPDFWRVVPKKKEKGIMVPKQELIEAIKKVLPFTDKETNCIVFSARQGNMMVSSLGSGADVQKDIYCECEGTFQIGINGFYMLDVLNNINGVEKVTIQHTNALSQIRIDSEDSIFVVMPIKM